MAQLYAPAKVNLYLHVTGKRADGYHLLDSLIAFTDIVDVITVTPSACNSLTITGPFASALHQEQSADNLLMRVLEACVDAKQRLPGEDRKGEAFAITLEKNIPIGAGLGGGSSDAAALLDYLQDHWQIADAVIHTIAVSLGADIPVCLNPKARYVSGIGEILKPVEHIPPLHAVLVNLGAFVATPEVFKKGFSSFSKKVDPYGGEANAMHDFIGYLQNTHNDLLGNACEIAPSIAETIADLAARDDCLFATMSGSGSSCFALYETADKAKRAAKYMQEKYPNGWVKPCLIG